MISSEDQIKLFLMSIQLIENDLDRVEREYSINLSRLHQKSINKDTSYYPQIEMVIRDEANQMSKHYEVFYSLENSIRGLISKSLESVDANWWENGRVPPTIKKDAEDRQRREIDTGMTPRSEEPIDFTTFGELSEIIKKNWDVFGAIFNSQKAVERVMANLNTLRGPIAHCSLLADDEIVRLQLSVRDWFRLME